MPVTIVNSHTTYVTVVRQGTFAKVILHAVSGDQADYSMEGKPVLTNFEQRVNSDAWTAITSGDYGTEDYDAGVGETPKDNDADYTTIAELNGGLQKGVKKLKELTLNAAVTSGLLVEFRVSTDNGATWYYSNPVSAA